MIKFPNPAALLRPDDIPIERLNKSPREIKAARGEPRVNLLLGGGIELKSEEQIQSWYASAIAERIMEEAHGAPRGCNEWRNE